MRVNMSYKQCDLYKAVIKLGEDLEKCQCTGGKKICQHCPIKNP